METQFIGLRMVVTLKHPAGTRLQGTVSSVHAGTSLTLSDVTILGVPGPNVPRIDIDPDNIADLYEGQADAPPSTFTAPAIEPVSAPVFPQQSQPAFVDPAILSVGARPASASRPGDDLHDQAANREGRDPRPGQVGVLPPLHLGRSSRPLTPASSGVGEGIAGLAIDSPTPDRSGPPIRAPLQEPEIQSGSKNSKRRQRQKQGAKQTPLGGGDGSTAAAPGVASRGKGWRQTPILESTASFQPYNSLRKNGAKGKHARADNGWASEDVTEEMGEFDFESGLRKFDKRTLFDQMRKQDQVDDADRLVSHNRRPKPGTAGGKNLHHTENVLDLPPTASKAEDDFWNSEADDRANGESRTSGRDLRSAQSNRRGESKSTATRRSQSRKASAVAGGHPLNRVNSTGHGSQPGFYVLPSNRRVETISALQMLNLENIAANDVGLTEDMTTENAGRGIAEVALTALSDPAIRVRMASISTEPAANPANSATIVILAGNNKSGIRAVAAARHLRSRGANILLCLVGIDRERDLLEGMRQQIRIYRNFGGRVFAKQELFDYLHKSNATNTPVSVTLIIDALLGLTLSFEELRTGDQASVYELINWANRNEAFVLAVDVPTGIDPSTGKVNIIDRARLYVKPRYVVAMGAPKHGLLEAMSPQNEEVGARVIGNNIGESLTEGDEWRLFIADLGLGSGVWKKAGTKNRRGIDFDDKWVLEMRYQGPATDDDED